MPSSSLTAILDHGFEKGSGRVGRAQKLDEVVKANLAVNAHIRHTMTDYDSLYSTLKAADPSHAQDVRTQARIAVYDQVKRIADSWRTGISRPALAEVGNNSGNTAPPTQARQGTDQRHTYSGVQKKVQPKRVARDINALNKALESMGLEDLAPAEGKKIKLLKDVRLQNRSNQSEEDLRLWRAGSTHILANRLHHILKLQGADLTIEEERKIKAARVQLLSLRSQARKARRN